MIWAQVSFQFAQLSGIPRLLTAPSFVAAATKASMSCCAYAAGTAIDKALASKLVIRIFFMI
ncbi:hypothetical protein D3C75_1218870 [compost metagenome]